MLKEKIDFVKKWKFASPISVKIDQFWPTDTKCFHDDHRLNFSTPLDSSWWVDDFKAQVCQNWMKNGWVMSKFVKRGSIIVHLLPNYYQKYGNFLWKEICEVNHLVEHGRLHHRPKLQLKRTENKPFTAYLLFESCKCVTKFSSVTWLFP